MKAYYFWQSVTTCSRDSIIYVYHKSGLAVSILTLIILIVVLSILPPSTSDLQEAAMVVIVSSLGSFWSNSSLSLESDLQKLTTVHACSGIKIDLHHLWTWNTRSQLVSHIAVLNGLSVLDCKSLGINRCPSCLLLCRNEQTFSAK